MTFRTRPVVLALAAAIVLIIALSKETWIAIPIVAGLGVVLLSRGHHLGRGTTVAALVFVASIAFVAFGSVITLMSQLAKNLAGLVFASGITVITLGVLGLLLSVIQLRRAMRSTAPVGDTANEPSASR